MQDQLNDFQNPEMKMISENAPDNIITINEPRIIGENVYLIAKDLVGGELVFVQFQQFEETMLIPRFTVLEFKTLK